MANIPNVVRIPTAPSHAGQPLRAESGASTTAGHIRNALAAATTPPRDQGHAAAVDTIIHNEPGLQETSFPSAPVLALAQPSGPRRPTQIPVDERPNQAPALEPGLGCSIIVSAAGLGCAGGIVGLTAAAVAAITSASETAAIAAGAGTGGLTCIAGAALSVWHLARSNPEAYHHILSQCQYTFCCTTPQQPAHPTLFTTDPGTLFTGQRHDASQQIRDWADSPGHFARDIVSLEPLQFPFIASTGTTLELPSFSAIPVDTYTVGNRRVRGMQDPQGVGNLTAGAHRPVMTHFYPNFPLYAAIQDWISAHEDAEAGAGAGAVHAEPTQPWYFPPADAMRHCADGDVRLYFNTETGGVHCTWNENTGHNDPLPASLDADARRPSQYIRDRLLESAFCAWRAAGYQWRGVTDCAATPALQPTVPAAAAADTADHSRVAWGARQGEDPRIAALLSTEFV